MLNIRRIIWVYDNFGLAGAIRMACYDVEAMLLYILYALTLPVQFVILWKKFYSMRMRRQYDRSND
jgi:hypothetical protein